MPTLQPFTPQDFQAFQGVLTSNPMIAELETGQLILDGSRVEFHEITDEDITSYAYNFRTQEAAKAMATAISHMDVPQPFVSEVFTKIG